MKDGRKENWKEKTHEPSKKEKKMKNERWKEGKLEGKNPRTIEERKKMKNERWKEGKLEGKNPRTIEERKNEK